MIALKSVWKFNENQFKFHWFINIITSVYSCIHFCNVCVIWRYALDSKSLAISTSTAKYFSKCCTVCRILPLLQNTEKDKIEFNYVSSYKSRQSQYCVICILKSYCWKKGIASNNDILIIPLINVTNFIKFLLINQLINTLKLILINLFQNLSHTGLIMKPWKRIMQPGWFVLPFI